jgi:hypothetical protein
MREYSVLKKLTVIVHYIIYFANILNVRNKMMNEKINALFNVCGFPNDEIMEIILDANKSLYIQRFAELIIQECIKAIDDGDGSMSSMAEHSMRSVCQSDIRSHFGIKKNQ